MQIFKKLRNDFYRDRVDKYVYFEKVFKLQQECTKLNMFFYVDELTAKEGDTLELNPDELYCIREENTKVGSVVMRNTYYLFFNNTCLVYSKSGHDRIIRVRIKHPQDKWVVSTTDSHVMAMNEYNEIYAWWDVDWMGLGKHDYNTIAKGGSWWKYVYEDIRRIYESVDMKTADYMFNDDYKEYTPGNTEISAWLESNGGGENDNRE